MPGPAGGAKCGGFGGFSFGVIFYHEGTVTNNCTLCPLCLNDLSQRAQHGHQRRVIVTQQGDQFLGGLFHPLLIFRFLFYLQDVGSQHFADRDIFGLQDVAEIAEFPGAR